MKVHIELDMTPEEARHVMGLPDVSGLQKKMMAEMERRMMGALETATDPEAILKAWYSWGNQGLDQFQRFVRENARDRSSR
jgi:hypothetical protein